MVAACSAVRTRFLRNDFGNGPSARASRPWAWLWASGRLVAGSNRPDPARQSRPVCRARGSAAQRALASRYRGTCGSIGGNGWGVFGLRRFGRSIENRGVRRGAHRRVRLDRCDSAFRLRSFLGPARPILFGQALFDQVLFDQILRWYDRKRRRRTVRNTVGATRTTVGEDSADGKPQVVHHRHCGKTAAGLAIGGRRDRDRRGVPLPSPAAPRGYR